VKPVQVSGTKREYLKEKINELEINSKNKIIRDLYKDMNEFKKDYQSRSNLIKNGNGDLLEDSLNIVNIWNCDILKFTLESSHFSCRTTFHIGIIHELITMCISYITV
jgi:RNA polymerase-interacting CarD/CdnL/TRCF family regulator